MKGKEVGGVKPDPSHWPDQLPSSIHDCKSDRDAFPLYALSVVRRRDGQDITFYTAEREFDALGRAVDHLPHGRQRSDFAETAISLSRLIQNVDAGPNIAEAEPDKDRVSVRLKAPEQAEVLAP
ncbi:hypothetical protein [Tardiphaga sp.]|jgi:hypothetical protein|uniref:hypothetical protein n=1 Tax=Tardiphaga sp. TaxID=1926292 RepID=UPI0037DA0388